MSINRKKAIKIFLWVLCVIIITNLPYITGVIAFVADEGHYRYSNSDGSSTYTEFNNHDFDLAIRRHSSCNRLRSSKADQTLYRLFKKEPFAFWRWGRYFYDERYKLPYKDWKLIQKNRATIIGAGCYRSF